MKACIICFLVFFEILAGATDRACKVVGSRNPLAAKSDPDWVGFCGFFGSRNLLHQAICDEATSPNCVQPSVLQVIAAGMKTSGTYSITSSQQMFDEIARDGIIEESCLPFASIFKPPSDNDKLSYSSNFNREILRAFSSALSVPERNLLSAKPPCPDMHKLSIEDQSALVGKIARSIELKVGEEIQRVVAQSDCPRKKVSPLSLQNGPQQNPEQALSKIRDRLDQNLAVIVDLFVKQPDGSGRAPHVVVVTNYRTTCCGPTCVTEYQVIDSLGHYWTDQYDGWVSEEDMRSSINPAQPMITWLEPKSQ